MFGQSAHRLYRIRRRMSCHRERQITFLSGHPGVPEREARLLGGVFFTQYAAVGLIMMLPLVLTDRGLAPHQIGLLSAIFATSGALTQVWLGGLSDRFRKRRPFIIAPAVALAALYASLAGISSFAAVAFIYAVAGAAFHCAVMAVTAMIADWSASAGRTPSSFARIRLWGSAGFVASLALLSPWLKSDALVIGGTSLMFLTMGILGAAAREPEERAMVASRLNGGAKRLFRDRTLSAFLLTYFLFKVAESGTMAFFALRIHELGGERHIAAWALVVNAVCEMPLMLAAGPLCERAGPGTVLLTALLVQPFRLLAYGLMPSVHWVWPVQLFHGFTYAFMLVGAVAFVNGRAPDDLRATAQGMLGMATAAGMAAGPLAGSLLAREMPLSGLFVFFAAVSALAIPLFAAAGRPVWKVSGPQQPKLTAE